MKINLLTDEFTDPTSFNAEWLQPTYNKFFNIIQYDKSKQYDKKSTLVVNSIDNDSSWSAHLTDFKVIVDNLSELKQVQDTENKKYLDCENWFWYHEALWYLHLGYHTYVPSRTYEKLAFMPLRLQKNFRNKLIKSLTPWLDDFVYSYVDKGIMLPDDKKFNGNDVDQRYFNKDWYNKTCFSLVCETMVKSQNMFVTEKTFKTFGHQHPFIIFGIPGTLSFVRNLGFETFSNIFDETYDSEYFTNKRLQMIVENVKNFEKRPYDKETVDKIDHNKNLFYNLKLIQQRMIEEIIEPILEYAET